MNLNQLAVAISKQEGKKVQVNIAQIKEILRITIDILNGHNDIIKFTQNMSDKMLEMAGIMKVNYTGKKPKAKKKLKKKGEKKNVSIRRKTKVCS